MKFLDKYYKAIEDINFAHEDYNAIEKQVKLLFEDFIKHYFDYCKAYNEIIISNATLWNEREMLKRENEKLKLELEKYKDKVIINK